MQLAVIPALVLRLRARERSVVAVNAPAVTVFAVTVTPSITHITTTTRITTITHITTTTHTRHPAHMDSRRANKDLNFSYSHETYSGTRAIAVTAKVWDLNINSIE